VRADAIDVAAIGDYGKGDLFDLKSTKSRAMILRVAGLYTNDSTSTLTAIMDVYIGPLWAAGWDCLATKDQGEWRISQCQRMWVS
jgi:hypothetical protein